MNAAAVLKERLAFLGLTDDDRELLGHVRPLFEERASDFVDAFYRHLLAFDATRALLSSPEVKDRLLDVQRRYLLSLAPPALDEAYVADRIRIGETHARLGLDPSYYLGAYSLYLSLLTPAICEQYREQPAVAERTLTALTRVVMLDAQIAMQAYSSRRESQLEYVASELAESSRELERSYQDQTAELRETTARARAAERLASIGTLVAGLAHEIGTPMGVIQGHAEMLESSVDPGDERGRWRLQTIRDQIDRIAGIIQTLLNLARPRPPEAAPVDLPETIRACLDFLAEKLRRRRVEVEIDLGEGATMEGDRQKIQQLFLNLILNAADAMAEGGTLRIALTEEDDGQLEVSVRDTGHGIPSAALDRIFEPFYSTKPAGKGSGLGLMVAQGIVEEHGGTIEARSREGEGTEFVLRFPAQLPA